MNLLLTFWRSALLEWRHLARSGWDRAVIIWLPAVAIGSLWWIFSAGVVAQLPVAVVDLDHSAPSRQLVRFLRAAPALKVQQQSDAQQAAVALRAGAIYAYVVIPPAFAQKIVAGQDTGVRAVVNAQYGTHSGVIQRDLRAVVATFSAGVAQKRLTATGLSPEQVRAQVLPIDVQRRFAFNPVTNYQQFLAGALIPSLLHILATVAGAYGFGRTLRDRTLGVWFAGILRYRKTNYPFLQMMAMLHGKLFWPLLCYSVWGAFSVALLTQGEHLSPRAWLYSFLAYYILMALSLWLGVLLSAVPISLRMGLSASALITAPAFAFSGLTFPLYAMSPSARAIAEALPLAHYLRVQVMLVEKGASVTEVLPTLWGLGFASLALMPLAVFAATVARNHPQRWGQR